MASATDDIATIDICRRRGDNFAFQFTLTDSNDAAINITGFSFRLVVDPSPDPSDNTNNVLDVAGVITDAPNGVFEFQPTTNEMNITPGVYFHEVQMIDASSRVRTIVKGSFTVEQDIAK